MAKEQRRRTQEERSEETRNRLINAAFKVMQRRGYSGFRTADVVTAAGVSRGAMLHHFPTKESLVLATIEHLFRLAAEAGRRRAHSISVQKQDPLEAVIADMRDFFFGDNFFVSLDVVMAASKDKKFREKIFGIARANRTAVEEAWLEALLRAGVSRDKAEDLLWLTISIVRGFAIRSLWQDEPERFARLLDLWREMFWAHATSNRRGERAPAQKRLIQAG